MTKVTLHFKLLAPLTEKLMESIARVGSVYGMARVQLTPTLDGLTVDFDASRLSVDDVLATLREGAIPVERIHPRRA